MALKENYGKKIDTVLRTALVTKDNFICNTNYEGEATAGAVNIPVRGEATVGDYSTNSIGSNSVSYSTTAFIKAIVDKDKFVNEYIDGYEAEALPDNVKIQRLDSAAYGLAKAEDTHAIVTLLYAVQGKDKNGTTFGSTDARYQQTGNSVSATSSIFADLVDANKALTLKGVPSVGRYAICTPTTVAALVKSSDFVKASDLGQEIVKSGAIGKVCGMYIFESAELETNTANSTLGAKAIVGHPDFITRVEAWKVEPAIYDGNNDANIVGGALLKGRKVFTHEVTKPQAFAYIA